MSLVNVNKAYKVKNLIENSLGTLDKYAKKLYEDSQKISRVMEKLRDVNLLKLPEEEEFEPRAIYLYVDGLKKIVNDALKDLQKYKDEIGKAKKTLGKKAPSYKDKEISKIIEVVEGLENVYESVLGTNLEDTRDLEMRVPEREDLWKLARSMALSMSIIDSRYIEASLRAAKEEREEIKRKISELTKRINSLQEIVQRSNEERSEIQKKVNNGIDLSMIADVEMYRQELEYQEERLGEINERIKALESELETTRAAEKILAPKIYKQLLKAAYLKTAIDHILGKYKNKASIIRILAKKYDKILKSYEIAHGEPYRIRSKEEERRETPAPKQPQKPQPATTQQVQPAKPPAPKQPQKPQPRPSRKRKIFNLLKKFGRGLRGIIEKYAPKVYEKTVEGVKKAGPAFVKSLEEYNLVAVTPKQKGILAVYPTKK